MHVVGSKQRLLTSPSPRMQSRRQLPPPYRHEPSCLAASIGDRHKYRFWYDLISAVPKVPGVGSDDRHSSTGKARGHRGELPVDRLVKGGLVDEAKAIPHLHDVTKHHRDRLQRQSPRGRGHSVSSTCRELSFHVWHTGQSQTRLGELK